MEQVLAALGADADADATRAGEICLAAAARGLDALLSEQRFARESALPLLTVDALTTYAFEHASQGPDSAKRLDALASRAMRMLGQLTTQRV
jgi:hypothetical protein